MLFFPFIAVIIVQIGRSFDEFDVANTNEFAFTWLARFSPPSPFVVLLLASLFQRTKAYVVGYTPCVQKHRFIVG